MKNKYNEKLEEKKWKKWKIKTVTNTKGMHQNWDKNQPEHVLKLFLNFEKISASCSYKLGSYKKKKCKEQKVETSFFLVIVKQ